MKRTSALIVLAVLAVGLYAFPGAAQKKAPLPERYKKWMDEEVLYLITSLEREVFLKLLNDRERDQFIEAFWRHRDPTPNSPENEFKAEHYKRITYVNKYFGRTSPIPGWKSDRGRIYILLGEPNDIQHFDNKQGLYPCEIWFYQNKESLGLPTGFNLVFFQHGGFGDFLLYSPAKDGPQALMNTYTGDPLDYQSAYEILNEIDATVASAAMSLIPGDNSGFLGRPTLASDMLIQKVENSARAQVQELYAKKFLQYKDMVEVEYSANYLDCDALVKVSREPAGLYFVHYAVEPKRLSVGAYENKFSTTLKVNGTVTAADGKMVYQFDKPVTLNLDESQIRTANTLPFDMLDMFPLIPGTYRFSVLIKNEESKEFTSFEQTLLIPGRTPVLQMTSPVLGFKSARADAARATVKPFQFGPYLVSVQPNRVFTRKDTLAVAFQVFGLTEPQKAAGSVRFLFTRNDQPVLDKIRPLAEFQDLPSFLSEFPLAELVPAHYGLKVSVVAAGRELVAGTEEFDVSYQDALPRPWYHTKQLPGLGDPVYALIVGSQLFNVGRTEEARAEAESAYARLPNSVDAALLLARIQTAIGREAEVPAVLKPFLDAAGTPRYEVYVLAGQALLNTGDAAGALDIFNRAVSHFGVNAALLNVLGECYIRLGRPKDARTVWERSIQINPSQPEVRKKLDAIKDQP